MTLEGKGKVLYAGEAIFGKYYTTIKSGIVVKALRFSKNGRIILQSTETENELTVVEQYLLREVNQEEVRKEMAKKEVVKNGKKQNGKVKKASKICIDYALLAPFMKSGLPVRVADILGKVKVEETTRTPYYRIYATLDKQVTAKVLKKAGKGTFQLIGSNKKAVVKSTEKTKVKKVKPKTKKKVETKPKEETQKPEEKTESETPAGEEKPL